MAELTTSQRWFAATAFALLALMMLALAACDTGDEATATPAGPPTSTPIIADSPTSQPTETPVSTATQTAGTPTQAATVTPTTEPLTIEPLRPLGLERAFAWSAPARSTHLEQAPNDSGRVFVSEQDGRILELTGDPTEPEGTERVVLDIRERVTGRATEEGLLGFALHPDFGDGSGKDRIFVHYSATNPRRSVISEFSFLPDGTIDPGSESEVIFVPQPQANHNGGMLAFGPDRLLYIALGDGGGAGDRPNNAQDISNVLGTILRIDVDVPGHAYAIPHDNPFVDGAGSDGAAREIWAYGLRNPWRFSFDQVTGELWAADVGQNAMEEINLVTRGGNYGWRLKEGTDCFNPSSGCERDGLIEPVATYGHSDGCSVTGGYVYRGDRLPSLYGAYIYADFCSGRIWALRHQDGGVREQIVLADTGHRISAFGQTLDGEVYILAHSTSSGSSDDRSIFRFVEP